MFDTSARIRELYDYIFDALLGSELTGRARTEDGRGRSTRAQRGRCPVAEVDAHIAGSAAAEPAMHQEPATCADEY